jgi:anti-sigma-K factor RskA
MAHEHVGDRAELYALGALDERESATIESHVRRCASCADLVGLAEHDVASIASMESQRSAPPELAGRIERALQVNRRTPLGHAARHPWPIAAALAAALVLGLLPSAYFWSENRALHGTMLAQSAAMARLAGAHRTATFRAAPGGPPAEVMYAPDGSWYLVVVRDTSKPLAVAWMHDGERTMLGSAIPRGTLATLYLPKSHRMDRLALMDGGRIVAEATLSWQKTNPNRQGARSG